jgi:hypothetical protein
MLCALAAVSSDKTNILHDLLQLTTVSKPQATGRHWFTEHIKLQHQQIVNHHRFSRALIVVCEASFE